MPHKLSPRRYRPLHLEGWILRSYLSGKKYGSEQFLQHSNRSIADCIGRRHLQGNTKWKNRSASHSGISNRSILIPRRVRPPYSFHVDNSPSV